MKATANATNAAIKLNKKGLGGRGGRGGRGGKRRGAGRVSELGVPLVQRTVYLTEAEIKLLTELGKYTQANGIETHSISRGIRQVISELG